MADAHAQSGWNAQSPNLQHSYGPELAPNETSAYHAPQVAGQDLPQVVPQQQWPSSYYKPEDQQPQVVDPSQAYHYNHTPPPPAPPVPEKEKKKVLGLPVVAFWIVAAAILLAVLGIGLGAGLGIGLKNSSSQSATVSTTTSSSSPATTTSGGETSTQAISSATTSSTSTSTSSAPVTSGTVGLADNSCTSTTPSTKEAKDGTTFTAYCFTDWPNGDTASDGSGNVTDLTRYTVYTFEACMTKCVEYNKALSSGDTECQAVTYNSNLTSILAIGQQGGDCFLKDKKGVDRQGSATSACAAMVF